MVSDFPENGIQYVLGRKFPLAMEPPMMIPSKSFMSIASSVAFLGLTGCQDACHDGDPSTCCCRDRWGFCRDPSNGNLPDQDVTCGDPRSSSYSSSGSSGSTAPATSVTPPPLPQLPEPSAPSGMGNERGWEWSVVVGDNYPVKLCCAVGNAEPSLTQNCQEGKWSSTNMHTDAGQIARCQTFKEGWRPSPIGTIGYPFH